MKTTLALKKVAALATLTCASLGANAAIFDSITTTSPLDSFAGGVVSPLTLSDRSFGDFFTFSLTDLSDISFSLGNTTIPGFSTIFSSASLYSTGPNGFALLGTVSTDSTPTTFSALNAGSYGLQVAGFAAGAVGGLYNGAISISSVSAVPEPETYAMLLAGLGLVGAVARRRNKKEVG